MITSISASLGMQRIDGSDGGAYVQILKCTNAKKGTCDSLGYTAAEPHQAGI